MNQAGGDSGRTTIDGAGALTTGLTTDTWLSGDQGVAFDAAYGGCHCDHSSRQRELEAARARGTETAADSLRPACGDKIAATHGKAVASARVVAEISPPIAAGSLVRIYDLGSSRFPREEGLARVVSCLDWERQVYRVRFLANPERVWVRAVIAAWQDRSPADVLAPLIAHWRANLARAAFGDIDYVPVHFHCAVPIDPTVPSAPLPPPKPGIRCPEGGAA